MNNIHIGDLDQFLGRTEHNPEFSKIVEKRILTVQHQDGTKEAICPNCKSKMLYRDLGVTMYPDGGMQDHGGFWECQNTKCGYQSEEEDG